MSHVRYLVAYISYLLILTGFFTVRAENETNLELPTQFQMPQTRESYLGVPGSSRAGTNTYDDLTELLVVDPYFVAVQANYPASAAYLPEQLEIDFSLLDVDFELPHGFMEGLRQEPLNHVQKFFNERVVPENSRTFPNDYISQSENFINQIYNHGKNLAPQPHCSSDLLSNTQIPGNNQIQLAGNSEKAKPDELWENVIVQQIFGETDDKSSKNATDYGNSSTKTNDHEKTMEETTACDKALTNDGEPLKKIRKIGKCVVETAVAPHEYVCGSSGCEERFNLIERYVQHLRNHNKKSEFVCCWLFCGTPLATSALLSEHLLQHVLTDSPNASVHKCADCLEWFWRKSRLTSHQAADHANKCVCRCNYSGCSWSFAKQSWLDSHMMVHNGSSAAKCPWIGCSAQFPTLSELENHVCLMHLSRASRNSGPLTIPCSFDRGKRASDHRGEN